MEMHTQISVRTGAAFHRVERNKPWHIPLERRVRASRKAAVQVSHDSIESASREDLCDRPRREPGQVRSGTRALGRIPEREAVEPLRCMLL
jgi:hypothetical protein